MEKICVQKCTNKSKFVFRRLCLSRRQKSERAKMLFFSVASSCNLFLLQNVFPLAICVLFEIHVWEGNNILLDCFSIPGYANTWARFKSCGKDYKTGSWDEVRLQDDSQSSQTKTFLEDKSLGTKTSEDKDTFSARETAIWVYLQFSGSLQNTAICQKHTYKCKIQGARRVWWWLERKIFSRRFRRLTATQTVPCDVVLD